MAYYFLVERWQKLAGIKILREGFAIYPDEQGVDPDNQPSAGSIQILEVKNCIGNEPNKDFTYFFREKKEYVEKMIDTYVLGRENELPPIQAFKPYVGNDYWIIDGNHRLGAYKIAGIQEIRANILNEEDIKLYPPGTKWSKSQTVQPVSFSEAKEKYPLDSYFTQKKVLAIPADNAWVKSLRQKVRDM